MDAFVPIESMADPKFRRVQSVFDVGGQPVHAQFLRASRPTEAVIFRFHGALKRELRPLPAFQANIKSIQGHAHQVSICDPTMVSREGFSAAWYAGTDELDTQKLLREFCRRVAEVLGAKRRIYLGSSAGGFAALQLSFYDAESIALVTVPQTNLQRHFHSGAVRKYFDVCWPGLSMDEVAQRTCIDVCELYRAGFDNTVIYIQSMGDQAHNVLQMKPFMDAAWGEEPSSGRNLAVVSNFWGKMGHGGVIPPEGYLPWVRAAIAAPATDQETLMMTYHTMSGEMPIMTSDKDRPTADFGANDLRFADLLRDISLKEAGGPK